MKDTIIQNNATIIRKEGANSVKALAGTLGLAVALVMINRQINITI